MRKKKLLSAEESKEMFAELTLIETPEEARAFHKKYNKYGYGIPFSMRYPKMIGALRWVPVLVSAISLAISIAVLLR